MSVLDASPTTDEPVPATAAHVAPGSEWRVARALAVVESKLLLRGAVVPAALALFMSFGIRGSLVDLRTMSHGAAFSFLPLAAVMLVVSHRAVTRPRREGSEELFEATPAGDRARTAGHLLAVTAPTAVAAVIVALVVALALTGEHVGHVIWAELAVGPMLVAGAACLGVLLARMWPPRILPFLACVAVAVVELSVNTPRLAGSGARWLAFWVEGSMWWLLPRHSGAHLVYLVGLVAMAAVGALLRHGATRRMLAAGVVAVAVTASAAAVQARQPQDHWRRVNAMFVEPSSQQRCTTRDGVTYCTFAGFGGLVDHFDSMVGRVRAATPAEAWRPGLRVVQRVTALDFQYAGDMADWLPHVPAMPRERIRQPDDGELHPGLEFGWSPFQDFGFGVQVAARSVGLPLVPDPDTGDACVAAGQARAVVALWLGAHADNALAWWLDRLAELLPVGRSPADALVPVAEADVYGGFLVSVEDVRLARRLARADSARTRDVVAEHWQALTDPATDSVRVAELVGVERPATAEPRQPFVAALEPDIVGIGAACP